MEKNQILSSRERALLFDPPKDDPAKIVKHYTLSPDDLALISQRRRPENVLGMAVQLAYLRYPGRAIAPGEIPPQLLLDTIADQVGVPARHFQAYGNRPQTRNEHITELHGYLGLRPFRRQDSPAMQQIARREAIGTDRGEAIVKAMVERLRGAAIVLPAPQELERIALAARAEARRDAYETLITRLTAGQKAALLSLVKPEGDETLFSWIRSPSRKNTYKNLTNVIDRLHTIRNLKIEPDRRHRIHRARYAAIVEENKHLNAQHIRRFGDQRKFASLVIFATEMEEVLTDASISLFLQLLSKVTREADNAFKERQLEEGKRDGSLKRQLVKMSRALLRAESSSDDLHAAVETSIGWEKLKQLIEEDKEVNEARRDDNLTEVVSRYPAIQRTARIVLETFSFHSWRDDDPVIAAIDGLRQRYRSPESKPATTLPAEYLSRQWREVIGTGKSFSSRAYDIAVIMQIRDRLRAGDIWVEGSRSYRAFDDFLLPPVVFHEKKVKDQLELAVESNFQDWRDRIVPLLQSRLETVDWQAANGELPDAAMQNGQLAITPIRAGGPKESIALSRRLYAMLPRVRITELLAEVNGWVGLADHFLHLQKGSRPEDPHTVLTAVLADATNLGLSRMARSSGWITRDKLVWAAQMHIRDETYKAALATLVEAIHAEPLTALWGDGDTSASDGQFFRAGGHGSAGATYNARYGSESGSKFYSHITDRYGPYWIQVIAANANEAPYILDGILHHETSRPIKEHYADTGGDAAHVFGFCHLLGIRFAPRIRGIQDRKLFVPDKRKAYSELASMIAGDLNLGVVEENWDEILRMGASLRTGTVPPSVLLKKLAAYPRQNTQARAMREVGRLDRSIFMLDWFSDLSLRHRAQAGLNKKEAKHALGRAVFFFRQGEIRDRSYENQCYRASGLNLVIAAIVLWNTRYLTRAIEELRAAGEFIPDDFLAHVAPLGWGHITLNGDYIWPEKPFEQIYRPLHNPLKSILEVA